MSHDLLNHKSKCRLCFQRISASRNSVKITEKVQNKFFGLTNIELKSSDKFSNHICKSCIKCLNDSCDFQQKIVDNQRRLYAFEDDRKLIVKAEPIQLGAIELQEIMFADLLPKTEVFDGSWIEEQSPEFQDFAEIASPGSPDNNASATPPNEAEDDCQEDSDKRPAPSTIKQKKRSRVNYEPEQLFNAVEAVSLGELSALEASKQFGVPRRTVAKRFNADYFLLTDLEELQVKLYVNRRTEVGIPSTDDDIEKFILFRLLCKRRGKDRVKIKSLSSTWVSMFRKRHSDMNVLEKQLDGKLSCDICGFSVCEKRKMRTHMDLHAQTENLQKPPKRRFKCSSDAFEKAMKLVAGGMSMSKAAMLHGIGRSTFHRRRQNEAKERSGVEPEIFHCSFCEKVFFKKGSRHSHEVTHHLTPVGEFPCEVCGKVFSTQIKLKTHQKDVHLKVVHKCGKCQEVFATKHKLKVHRQIHSNELACHICGKLMPVGGKMGEHLRTHAPRDQFKCTFEGCSKAYAGMQGLSYHIENSHTPNQNIKCPKCDKTFPNQYRLKFHVDRSHAAPRFFCEVDGCSYKNTRMEYLKLHLRNHKDIDVKHRDELIANIRVHKAGP